jgi:HTH-type transcriptional regulator, quorum sensing regulator NprR
MTYQVYAQYLLVVKDYGKAIEFAYKATDIFDKMGLFRDAAESLQVAVEVHAELGRVNKAFETQRRVSDLLRRSQDN